MNIDTTVEEHAALQERVEALEVCLKKVLSAVMRDGRSSSDVVDIVNEAMGVLYAEANSKAAK